MFAVAQLTLELVGLARLLQGDEDRLVAGVVSVLVRFFHAARQLDGVAEEVVGEAAQLAVGGALAHPRDQHRPPLHRRAAAGEVVLLGPLAAPHPVADVERAEQASLGLDLEGAFDRVVVEHELAVEHVAEQWWRRLGLLRLQGELDVAGVHRAELAQDPAERVVLERFAADVERVAVAKGDLAIASPVLIPDHQMPGELGFEAGDVDRGEAVLGAQLAGGILTTLDHGLLGVMS